MKKLYVLIISALVILGGGIGYWIVSHNATGTKHMSSDGINYSPATKQDKAYSDSRKQASVQSSANSSTTTQDNSSISQSQASQASKTKVYPIITTHYQSNGNLTVNGFVQGVVENGGTCTLTLTKQGVAVQQTHPGAVNASTTTCGGIVVPLDKLSSGDWQAVLSYSSTKYQGTSSSTSITIQ